MTTDVHSKPPVIVEPPAESRLAQLHAAYPAAKAAADEAAATLKAITDAIKLELTQAAPDEERVTLRGDGPTLALTYAERWTIDSRKLKAEDPETYVRYAKKGGSWTLKALPQGGAE